MTSTLNIDAIDIVSIDEPTFCLRPGTFPSIRLFDNLAETDDLESSLALESLLNPRLRAEIGDINLVRNEELFRGPGASVIMSAFTHVRFPSLFSDGNHGVLYTCRSLQTAEEEALHHRERFLASTNEPPFGIAMNIYQVNVNATLHDLRGPDFAEDDPFARQLGMHLRSKGAMGIIYRSSLDPGGEYIALFRPRAATGARHVGRLTMVWDGVMITDVLHLLPKDTI